MDFSWTLQIAKFSHPDFIELNIEPPQSGKSFNTSEEIISLHSVIVAVLSGDIVDFKFHQKISLLGFYTHLHTLCTTRLQYKCWLPSPA